MNNSTRTSSKDQPPDPMDPDEVARLMRLAQGGDEESFGQIVRAYDRRLYAVVYRMVNNEQDAREVTQQAWVKVWQRLDSFQAESQLFTWIYRITVNTGLDFLRQRKRRREVSVYEPGPDGEVSEPRWPGVSDQTPDRELARQEFREKFDEALGSLSADHRAALILREVDGRSYQEIAEILKCRIGTVMSRIFYARRQLQQQLRGILP